MRPELEGQILESLKSREDRTEGQLESARLPSESARARQEAQRERGEWARPWTGFWSAGR